MTARTRPRLEEFLLALLWTVGTAAWGYFGVVGYIENLRGTGFNLTGFVTSFFLICLTVFGLRFAFNVYLRLWRTPPAWFDTFTSLTLGTILILGSLFSLFTLGITIYYLFTAQTTNLVFGWGIAACLALAGLFVFQFLAALNIFEPFLSLTQGNEEEIKPGFNPLGWLLRLQRRLHGRNFGSHRPGNQLHGPLILETDSRTSLIEEKTEKTNGQPGLEKTLVAHGGFHVTMLGFTANGATIFAVSDGGMVHFQAGGRKGVMFPPELKFWETGSGRVQVATLGASQTFLTSQYKTPGSLQNYRFLVPSGGGRFAWVSPNQIQVGNWSNEQTHTLEVEEGLVLRGQGGFNPMAFNPEGSRLAWCTPDGQTRFWNLETEQVQPLRAYPARETDSEAASSSSDGVWGLVFSPDGTRIATLGGRGILLQNVYTGWRWFRPLEPTREKLTAFAFNSSGFEMAVGMAVKPEAIRFPGQSKRNRNGNNNNGNHSPTPAEMLTAVGIDPETTEFVPIVRLWDLRDDRYVDLLAGKTPLRELAYSPDNRMLAGVDEQGILRLWEISIEGSANRAPRLILQLDLGLTGRKVVVGFSPDMRQLFSATDNRILLWNLARLKQAAQV